jgi:Aminoglycoside-2''-adenylyltransferase
MRAAVPDAGSFAHELVEWDAWSPAQVARRLAGIEAPWYVAAGWAIDLFLGGRRREHEDLEIAVPSDRFEEVADALAELELFVVGPDPALADPPPDRGIATPLAEAGALLRTYHQTWALDRAARAWRLDVFREPSDGDTWICRRHESVRLPYDELIERTPEGIPYGRPEVVLLFKAKHAHLAKNEADLAATLPRLDDERRRWLADALELAHPGHPWLDRVNR